VDRKASANKCLAELDGRLERTDNGTRKKNLTSKRNLAIVLFYLVRGRTRLGCDRRAIGITTHRLTLGLSKHFSV
jgi:hypothetical protein